MKREYAVIIGAMKAGTSSLFNYLGKHPQVCLCKVKEPEFFSRNRQGVNSRRVTRISEYERLWKYDPAVHQVCLEASTGYTKFPEEQGVPARMSAYGLAPWFIYLVRNPFDRIESHCNHRLVLRGKSFEDVTHPELIDPTRYALQLQQYLDVYPDRSRLLVLDFDELRHSPEQVVQRCLDFLGLEKIPLMLERGEKYNATPTSTADYLLGRLRGNAIVNSVFSGSRRMVAQRIVRKSLPFLRAASPQSQKIRLSASDRVRIHDLLRDDMLTLGRQFGINVSNWGFE